jgi:hypothetical protein
VSLFICVFVIVLLRIPKHQGFYIFGLHHPTQQVFSDLQFQLPSVDIKGAFYINLDTSVNRKEKFLEMYNGPLPLNRIEGVRAEKGTLLVKKGTYGCTLAHMNAVKEVADKLTGWWCIFEDDCVGDFSKIPNNLYIKNIVHRTQKAFINLSAHKNNEEYSLSRVHFHANAYLVKAEKAAEIYNIIEKNKWKYDVDTIYSMSLCNFKFPYNNGNSLGASVNLLGQNMQFNSDRVNLDNLIN